MACCAPRVVDQTLTSFCLCSLTSTSCEICWVLRPYGLLFISVSLLFCTQGAILLGTSSGVSMALEQLTKRLTCSCVPGPRDIWATLGWCRPESRGGRKPSFSIVSFPRAWALAALCGIPSRARGCVVSFCQLLLGNLSWLPLPCFLPCRHLVPLWP